MHTNHITILALVLTAATLFSGCLEKYEVTTVISPDGSCERVVSLKRDSQKIPDSAFPIPVDSSWTRSWSAAAQDTTSGQMGEKKSEWVYTARKRFADPEALSREYPGSGNPANLSITVRVEKKFRWFYTYYTYDETYGRFDPLREEPQPSSFFTEEEIHRFVSSEKPDSVLDARWKQWDERRKNEWVFGRILDLVKRRNDPALPVSLVETHKEELIKSWTQDTTGGQKKTPKRDQASKNTRKHDAPSNEVLDGFVRILHTKAVLGLAPGLDSLMGEFMRRDSIVSRAKGDYTNSVTLPGVIVSTNAQEVRGTTAAWRFSYEHLSLADYRMQAESRVANAWAMIVSGIVVLAAIVFPLLRGRR